MKNYQAYGFTHGEYLDTIDVGWIHVWTPYSVIAREVWRRYHLYKDERNLTRDVAKQVIRQLFEDHRSNRQVVIDYKL